MNFFSDNPHLKFLFDSLELERLAELKEDGFKEKSLFPYAPADSKEAREAYGRVLELVGDIAANFIAPLSAEIDKEGNTLKDGGVIYGKNIKACLEILGQADLMGFTLPRRFGGLNLPALIYTIAIDIVSRADASLMNIFGLQGIAETINAFASEEIKKQYLPGFASGKFTGAMALTEPDAGSDLQRVRLKAFQDAKGGWRLNGVKRFITNGCGEILLVLARSEPKEEGGLGLSLFLCEKGEGVRIRRLEDKLGIHGSPTCEIEFNDAPSLIIGERRRGLVTYVMALMNGARLGIAAQSLGIAQESLKKAQEFAHTRQQFGARIENIPAVAEMLLDMEVELEASRALTYETAYIVDLYQCLALKSSSLRPEVKGYERLAGFLTPCCKYYASEMSVTVSSRAIQVLGGSGYMRDYAVERLFRDSRITTIYEGTSQLQVVAAVRGVLSGVAEKRFKEMAGWTFSASMEKELKALLRARKLLEKAVAFLKARGHDYTELYARYLVDMAIDIYIGYLFLRQVTLEEKRSRLSQRFFAGFRPRLMKNYLFLKSGDTSPLNRL